jgi:hypothetical protein
MIDLWPDDIRVEVLEPLEILRAQEDSLAQKTNRLLRAEVRTTDYKDKNEKVTTIAHSLDLIAPVLNEYRITLLRATHSADAIYPVLAESRVFDPDFRPAGVSIPKVGGYAGIATSPLAQVQATAEMLYGSPAKPDPQYRLGATQEEFTNLVREVLTSVWVRGLIESLIARSNSVLQNKIGNKPSDDSAKP